MIPASVEVPFLLWGNRQLLTREQIENDPALAHFVNQFPNCFEWLSHVDICVFYPEGKE